MSSRRWRNKVEYPMGVLAVFMSAGDDGYLFADVTYQEYQWAAFRQDHLHAARSYPSGKL
jgi:hypothetical protein